MGDRERQNLSAPVLDLGTENELPPLMTREDEDSVDESYNSDDDESEGDDENLESISNDEIAELLDESAGPQGSPEENGTDDNNSDEELGDDEPSNDAEANEGDDEVSEQIMQEDGSKDGDTIGDSAPDLTSEDDCRVLRRDVRSPERYNPSSGKSYHQEVSDYSETEICHNLIAQVEDPSKSFSYEDGEEKVLVSITQRLKR